MAKFIELTQHIQNFGENYDRKIKVNIEHIDFYYDKHIVFGKRAIDVFESYDEITKLLEKQQYLTNKENKYRVYYINTKNLRGYSDMIPVSALNKEDAKDKVLKFLKSTKKDQDIIITRVEDE